MNITNNRKRGFNNFRREVRDRHTMRRAISDCRNCKHYNSDDECTNSKVTSYDFVEEENGRRYCNFWEYFEFDNGRKKKKEWYDF